jgi:hypothetical protein
MSSIRQKMARRKHPLLPEKQIVELESRIVFLEREKEKIQLENLRLRTRVGELELALHDALSANREIFLGKEPLVS